MADSMKKPAREYDLETFVRWVNDFETATADARSLSERDRDYRDGKQWTEDEEAELRQRAQPIVTMNRIAPKCDFIIGQAIRTKTKPKALPRTPKHEKAADAATQALRYVSEDSQFDAESLEVLEALTIDGYGGGGVEIEPLPNGDVKICVTAFPFDRMFYDIHSRKADYSDASHLGLITWMTYDDIIDRWPDAADILEQSTDNTGDGNTFEDRPRFAWVQNIEGERRYKVSEVYYWTGRGRYNRTCMHAVFVSGGFLEEPAPSTLLDEHKRPTCPWVFRSNKCDRDNNRYGSLRHLISPQDEINKRRSKALHLLNMRQMIMDEGAADPNEIRQEAAKPDGLFIKRNGTEMTPLPTTDMAQGNLQMLAEAKAEIDAVGPNAALAGRDVGAQSGRAIMAKQEGGFIELEPLFFGFREWKLGMYRLFWYAIRQYWTQERWVRVTDDPSNLEFVGFNIPKPVTLGEMLQEQGRQIPPEMMADPAVQAQLQEVVGTRIENNLAELDIDIILDEGPSTATLQHEELQLLSDLVARGVPVPPEAIIEVSSIRNKEAILKRMRPDPAQMQEAAQQKQLMQQSAHLGLAEQEAKVKKTHAETQKLTAETMATVTESRLNALTGVKELVAPPDSAGPHQASRVSAPGAF